MLQSILQGITGVVGVYMALDDVVIVHHHSTVANALQVGAQSQGVSPLGILEHDELGAVGEGDLPFIEAGGIALVRDLGGGLLPRFLLQFDDCTALEHLLHALHDIHQACTASVHHTGLLQHRQQLRGFLQGLLGAIDHGLPDPGLGALSGQRLGALLVGHTGHGEDGALGGLHNRLIGSLDTGIHGLYQIGSRGFRLAGQALGKAAEQQRQDHTRVAPGTPEQCAGCGLGDLGNSGLAVHQLYLPLGSGDGHGHIGTGIAVRHRKYIECVYFLLMV